MSTDLKDEELSSDADQASEYDESRIIQGPSVDLERNVTTLKLLHYLDSFPEEILGLCNTLEHLDLPRNPISALPNNLYRLHKLKVAFFSDCEFEVFPEQLAPCRSLELIAFKNNGMTGIPEDVFPRRLRWLILTNNNLTSLPRSIGNCYRLQKCMLAGNRLSCLPEKMANCQRLGLLRISANQFHSFPAWLFTLPELAFLSLGHNPCMPSHEENTTSLPSATWFEIQIEEQLGSGASGVIYRGGWKPSDVASMSSLDSALYAKSPEIPWFFGNHVPVAVKLFHSTITSDGHPLSELLAYGAVRSHTHFPHQNLVHPVKSIAQHPLGRHGLLMQLVPAAFTALGLPPSFDTCTRDVFAPDTTLNISQVQEILKGVASAMTYLYDVRVALGDLYAHNIMVDGEGTPLLSDLGAASVLPSDFECEAEMERMEILAFGHLAEDLLDLLNKRDGSHDVTEVEALVLEKLCELHARCTHRVIISRPDFSEVVTMLQDVVSDPQLDF